MMVAYQTNGELIRGGWLSKCKSKGLSLKKEKKRGEFNMGDTSKRGRVKPTALERKEWQNMYFLPKTGSDCEGESTQKG